MITCLNGTLIRQTDGSWKWSNGNPEPRIRDLSPDEWNFRCCTRGGKTFVEVLRGVAQESEILGWVIGGAKSGKYESGKSGDHTGPLTIDDYGVHRMHIQNGEDPLLGNEPLPESRGPIPSVILVPVEDWDAWVKANPAGASWDLANETEILDLAYSLGWRPSESYKSRDTGKLYGI
jgi:hypothetical protein